MFLSNTLLPLCDIPVRQVIVGGELQVCDKRGLTSSRQRLRLVSHMLYQILIAFKPLLHKQTVTLSGFTELDKHFSFIPLLSVPGQTVGQNKRIRFSFCPLRYFCKMIKHPFTQALPVVHTRQS